MAEHFPVTVQPDLSSSQWDFCVFCSCARLDFGWDVDGSWAGACSPPTPLPEILGVFFSKKLFHVAALGRQILLIVFQVENLLFQFCAETVEQRW